LARTIRVMHMANSRKASNVHVLKVEWSATAVSPGSLSGPPMNV
jgi:hypothetical protein